MPHDIGMDYERWFVEHMFMIAPAAGLRRPVAAELPEFPPRQKPGSFNLDRVMEAVTSRRAAAGNATLAEMLKTIARAYPAAPDVSLSNVAAG